NLGAQTRETRTWQMLKDRTWVQCESVTALSSCFSLKGNANQIDRNFKIARSIPLDCKGFTYTMHVPQKQPFNRTMVKVTIWTINSEGTDAYRLCFKVAVSILYSVAMLWYGIDRYPKF
ncbi:unnamed protein product, partial [Ilex paraguariensis]